MARIFAGDRNTSLLTVFIIVTTIAVFIFSFTRYFYTKNYLFYIEAPCDSATENCFVRNCDEYCPPNGLSSYKAYTIKASLYDSCTDNSCKNICEGNRSSQCTEIACDSENGDSCSGANQ